MEELLFLSHRIPYPPNKGDKVRSFNILKNLARRYRIHLGAFVDQPEDWARAEELKQWCETVFLLPLRPRKDRVLSLRGLMTGEALTLPYYRSRRMSDWVEEVKKGGNVRRCFVFSSSMAQYVENAAGMRRVIDFCDVDSAKWMEYAERRGGITSWIYRREGEKLLQYETRITMRCEVVTLVADHERKVFESLSPAVTGRVKVVNNGVDRGFFCPDFSLADPFAGVEAIVFTGAMDYWPNIDAVSWFARDVWPLVRSRHPALRFYVVGMNPSPAVKALQEIDGVVVTGSVPDVRPYLQHARLVVAPLRVARGIQNKILEAMAMDKQVVAHAQCAAPLVDANRYGLRQADTAHEFAEAVLEGLDKVARNDLGTPRDYVSRFYDWVTNVEGVEAMLEGAPNDQGGSTRQGLVDAFVGARN